VEEVTKLLAAGYWLLAKTQKAPALAAGLALLIYTIKFSDCHPERGARRTYVLTFPLNKQEISR
jgi:hypothetical protein